MARCFVMVGVEYIQWGAGTNVSVRCKTVTHHRRAPAFIFDPCYYDSSAILKSNAYRDGFGRYQLCIHEFVCSHAPDHNVRLLIIEG